MGLISCEDDSQLAWLYGYLYLWRGLCLCCLMYFGRVARAQNESWSIKETLGGQVTKRLYRICSIKWMMCDAELMHCFPEKIRKKREKEQEKKARRIGNETWLVTMSASASTIGFPLSKVSSCASSCVLSLYCMRNGNLVHALLRKTIIGYSAIILTLCLSIHLCEWWWHFKNVLRQEDSSTEYPADTCLSNSAHITVAWLKIKVQHVYSGLSISHIAERGDTCFLPQDNLSRRNMRHKRATDNADSACILTFITSRPHSKQKLYRLCIIHLPLPCLFKVCKSILLIIYGVSFWVSHLWGRDCSLNDDDDDESMSRCLRWLWLTMLAIRRRTLALAAPDCFLQVPVWWAFFAALIAFSTSSFVPDGILPTTDPSMGVMMSIRFLHTDTPVKYILEKWNSYAGEYIVLSE